MKKIVLKSESCIGCGACIGIDSEHFEFSEDGFSIIKSQDNLDSPLLADAIDACPVAIISIEEDLNSNNGNCNDDGCSGNSCECNEDADCEECHCHKDCCSNEKEDL